MPDWTAFWAVAGFLLFLVLGLSWITSGSLGSRERRDEGRPGADGQPGGEEQPGGDGRSGADGRVAADAIGGNGASADAAERGPGAETGVETVTEPGVTTGTEISVESGPDNVESTDRGSDHVVPTAAVRGGSQDAGGVESIPTAALLANVLLTHAGLGVVLLGAAALTGIPAAALGVDGTAWSTGSLAVLGGLAFGAVLATANVVLAASLDRIGVDPSEALRVALAPDSALGWAVLLLVILPLVAGFEELLFRAVLIGGAAAATGLSPWPFVVLSSIAFALGHGMQGKSGIAVTGVLGGVLGVAFVLTNSLLLVVIAHYVVNAVEFLLKEWLGWDLDGRP